MKKHYLTPEMDVVNFDCEDVITTSTIETPGSDIFD